MLLRPVPSSLRAGTVFVVVGVVVVVAVGLLIAVSGRWQVSPMALLGVGHVVRGVLLRRARVVLLHDGLVVNTGGVRDRHLAWADVAQVVVDPPGGPRLLRVRLREGGEVRLPELSEDDRARVLAAGAR
ncbi:PH domain-containing protein [Kineococcus sp. NPDC059986]|uniref:PH domain-containing protein n=1 Tax=Kineococcus sp. NPDC059986 TaxID=3155538 RepID=UPI00344C91D1